MGETVTYFWQGSRVRLRRHRTEDWEILLAQAEDSESMRVFEPGIPLPASPEMIQGWLARVNDGAGDFLTFAVENPAGDLVGSANIHNRNPQHGTFSCAIRIFRPHRRQGYAADALRILLRYGFYELRMQKCNSETMAGNAGSIALHQALGFQQEGRRRRNVFTGGRYHDEILFGMTAEEFEAVQSAA